MSDVCSPTTMNNASFERINEDNIASDAVVGQSQSATATGNNASNAVNSDSESQKQQQAPISPTSLKDMTDENNSVKTATIAGTHNSNSRRQTDMLLSEIKQKRQLIQQLEEEAFYYRHVNAELIERVHGTQERMVLRQKDQRQLLDNYNEHVRSRRATNDDVASIHKKLLELKNNIKRLGTALVQSNDYDPMATTQAISKFWVNLHEPISKLGEPLPPHRIQMLIEKFLMDVLVQNMNYNAFTGLKISQPYTQLQMWFERYEPSFCTRLRQEIAKVVVLHDVPGSDVAQEIQKLNKRMYTSLYTSLLKAFPSIEKHDQQLQQQQQQQQGSDSHGSENELQYSVMLRSMVEQASHIGYAMRGQEVEIAAAAVGEGTETFDPKTMVDEDGQTTGIIQFCICPPFILYGNRVELLEKARVLCSSAAPAQ